MSAVSRRKMLQSSFMSLGVPAVAAFMPLSASVQMDAPTPPAKRSPGIPHAALCAWITDNIAQASARRKVGTETREGAIHTASAIRMFALHLENIGIDSHSEWISSAIDPTKGDLSDSPITDGLYQSLVKYDSTANRRDLGTSISLSTDQINASKRLIASQGIAYQFRVMADLVHTEASKFPPQEMQADVSRRYETKQPLGTLSFAAFDLSRRPNLIRANSIKQACVKATCAALSNANANDAFTGALGTALGLVSPGVLCTLAGGSEVVFAVTTDGAGAILAPFAGAACGIAEAAAGIQIAAGITTGAITSVAIGQATRSWMAANCSTS